MITELTSDPGMAVSTDAPAIVVFYATWCGDCKRSLLYEKKLSDEFTGKLNFYRMDAEKFESVADQYWVENYPTYVFFKNGKANKKILVEPGSEEEVRSWIIGL